MHQEIKTKLKQLVDQARVPHAILFTENWGNGAVEVVLDFIKYLLCKHRDNLEPCNNCNSCHMVDNLAHPDLHFAFPTNSAQGQSKKGSIDEYYPVWRELLSRNLFFSEKDLYGALGMDNKTGTISVADAADIMRKLSLSSYEGGAKIVFIMFPEKMNVEAANKLLKSLEEPLPDTCFVMVSHAPQKLLSTILSRCLRIEIPPVGADEISNILTGRFGCSSEEAIIAARSSCGSVGRALEIVNEMHEDNEERDMFLQLLLTAANDGLYNTLSLGERLSGLGREKIKTIFTEGLDIIRKLLMISLNLGNLSFASQQEKKELGAIAGRLNDIDLKQIYDYTDSAIKLVERNVNAKFVISDFCNRIYFKFNNLQPYGK